MKGPRDDINPGREGKQQRNRNKDDIKNDNNNKLKKMKAVYIPVELFLLSKGDGPFSLNKNRSEAWDQICR